MYRTLLHGVTNSSGYEALKGLTLVKEIMSFTLPQSRLVTLKQIQAWIYVNKMTTKFCVAVHFSRNWDLKEVLVFNQILKEI